MKRYFLFCMIVLVPLCAFTAAKSSPYVPDQLKPWTQWVTHGSETQLDGVPRYNSASNPFCIWPSELILNISDTGGTFSQRLDVDCESYVTLPGGDPFWPADVAINGQSAIVTRTATRRPRVNLAPGVYTITGRFTWPHVPEYLSVPPGNALIKLTVHGQLIDYPQMDSEGKLWFLQSQETDTAVEDRLSLQDFRCIEDAIPALVHVHLKLDVAGTARQETLGPVFDPDRMTPMYVTCDLPLRIDETGEVTVQVRPGDWEINLGLRLNAPLEVLTFDRPADSLWPEESIWCFKAHNEYRIVDVTEGTAIDPMQTRLPSKWMELPTYLLKSGQSLRFNELQRGNPEPIPDQLSLERTAWLLFDGSGYTFQDRITGSKNSDWRMEMDEDISLGKVEVNGEIQFITRREDSSKPGVEVRTGALNMTADSEYSRSQQTIPQNGWNQEFKEVSTVINMPPGYRLIHVLGADNVPRTWISRWNLLDLFFVLLVTAALYKLFTWKEASIGFLCLVLLQHESGAPQWIWLAIICGLALERVVPENWFRRLLTGYLVAMFMFLALISTGFAVNHLKLAFFPQLSQSGRSIGGSLARSLPTASDSIYPMVGELASRENEYKQKAQSYQKVAQYDPSVQNQTGPGLPQWQWKSVAITTGPTQPGDTLKLFISGPRMNMGLGCLRVLLLIVLAGILLGPLYKKRKKLFQLPKPGIAVPILLIFMTIASVSASVPEPEHIDTPSDNLLKTLKSRLLEPADCFPDCASLNALTVATSEDRLTLTMKYSCEIESAVPLPVNDRQWVPYSVRIDGREAQALLRNEGFVWVRLDRGVHTVKLTGKFPPLNTFQIPLPMKPFTATASSDTWSIEGIRDDGSTASQLQFTRLEKNENRTINTIETGILPPFIAVKRQLLFGLDWRVETELIRETPHDAAIVLQIPLLPGESVLSESIEVENGVARITMGKNERRLVWESVLERSDTIVLKHPDTLDWREIWQVDVSPIYHLNFDGLPVIFEKEGQRWKPRWHPWPGEEVTLTLTRPEGVAGQTLTVQSSVLKISPGKRITDCSLILTVQSSQGSQYEIGLPEDARIQSIGVDGRNLPIRKEGRKLPIAIRPGLQVITIDWRQDSGVKWLTETPEIDLGMRSVNTTIEVTYPWSRWVLWLKGPKLGPAVLFWSLLIVILIGSIILGRTGWTPLKTWHWFVLILGMSQGVIPGVFLVITWFVVLHFRGRLSDGVSPGIFNLVQILIVCLTAVALVTMVSLIGMGLLGMPDMSIEGFGSSQSYFRWYQDACDDLLPQATIISVPILVYRIAMLIWALWTAFFLIRITDWIWKSFSRPVIWKGSSGDSKKG